MGKKDIVAAENREQLIFIKKKCLRNVEFYKSMGKLIVGSILINKNLNKTDLKVELH